MIIQDIHSAHAISITADTTMADNIEMVPTIIVETDSEAESIIEADTDITMRNM